MNTHTQERICVALAVLAILGIAFGMVSLYRDGLSRELKIKNLMAQQEVQDQWLTRLQTEVSELRQQNAEEAK